MKDELGDPFAALVLSDGTVPHTAEEALTALHPATAEGDPLREQMSFILREDSRIAVGSDTPSLDRRPRFLVTRGRLPCET